MLRFRRMKTLQKFASVHAHVHNHFEPRNIPWTRTECRGSLSSTAIQGRSTGWIRQVIRPA